MFSSPNSDKNNDSYYYFSTLADYAWCNTVWKLREPLATDLRILRASLAGNEQLASAFLWKGERAFAAGTNSLMYLPALLYYLGESGGDLKEAGAKTGLVYLEYSGINYAWNKSLAKLAKHKIINPIKWSNSLGHIMLVSDLFSTLNTSNFRTEIGKDINQQINFLEEKISQYPRGSIPALSLGLERMQLRIGRAAARATLKALALPSDAFNGMIEWMYNDAPAFLSDNFNKVSSFFSNPTNHKAPDNKLSKSQLSHLTHKAKQLYFFTLAKTIINAEIQREASIYASSLPSLDAQSALGNELSEAEKRANIARQLCGTHDSSDILKSSPEERPQIYYNYDSNTKSSIEVNLGGPTAKVIVQGGQITLHIGVWDALVMAALLLRDQAPGNAINQKLTEFSRYSYGGDDRYFSALFISRETAKNMAYKSLIKEINYQLSRFENENKTACELYDLIQALKYDVKDNANKKRDQHVAFHIRGSFNTTVNEERMVKWKKAAYHLFNHIDENIQKGNLRLAKVFFAELKKDFKNVNHFLQSIYDVEIALLEGNLDAALQLFESVKERLRFRLGIPPIDIQIGMPLFNAVEKKLFYQQINHPQKKNQVIERLLKQANQAVPMKQTAIDANILRKDCVQALTKLVDLTNTAESLNQNPDYQSILRLQEAIVSSATTDKNAFETLVSYLLLGGSENLVVKKYIEKKGTSVIDDKIVRTVYCILLKNNKLDEALSVLDDLIKPTHYDDYYRGKILLQKNDHTKGGLLLNKTADHLKVIYDTGISNISPEDLKILEDCYQDLALVATEPQSSLLYAKQCLLINNKNYFAQFIAANCILTLIDVKHFLQAKNWLQCIIVESDSEFLRNQAYISLKMISQMEQAYVYVQTNPLEKTELYTKISVTPLRNTMTNNSPINPLNKSHHWQRSIVNSDGFFNNNRQANVPTVTHSFATKKADSLTDKSFSKQTNPLDKLSLWNKSKVDSVILADRVFFEEVSKEIPPLTL